MRSSDTEWNDLQVFSEILYVCREPHTRIQILEETGLSMRRLNFCLKYLLKQNLVRYHYRKGTYVTTEAGLRLLQQLQHD